MVKKLAVLLIFFSPFFALSQTKSSDLTVYNWADYIEPNTIKEFQQKTGIKVKYDMYDNEEILRSKLSVGDSSYDVVFPSSYPVLSSMKNLNVFHKLDPNKLSNFKNLDEDVMHLVPGYKEGKIYAIPYMWGTVGIGYNEDKLKQIMPDAPIDSWRMVFDPEIISKFASCGIGFLDSPVDIYPSVLAYLHENPDLQDKKSLERIEKVLLKIRPYIKMFHSTNYIEALANGDLCLVVGYSSNVFSAKARAEAVGKGIKIDYSVPKEGTQIWIDVMAIPAKSKNVENAYKFLDYMMQPEVIAKNSNFIGSANGNKESIKYLNDNIKNNPLIYPAKDVKNRFFTVSPGNHKYERLRNRSWTKILSGN